MQETGKKPSGGTVIDIGITEGKAHWNLDPEELIAIALRAGQAKQTSSGAIAVDTGEFTGRSPKDKFTVKDQLTADTVWWGNFNIPFDSDKFEKLYRKMLAYLNGKEFFVRDAYACADSRYRLNLRVINEHAWANL